jgi:hypothetical protein
MQTSKVDQERRLATVRGACSRRRRGTAERESAVLDAFFSGSVVQLTIFVPLYLVIGVALWRSGVWEQRVIREELASEVGRSVTPGEYKDIIADRMLRTHRIDGMNPHRSAALVNAQHELAFRKRRVRDYGTDPEQDDLVSRWRDQQHLDNLIDVTSI